MPRNTLTTEDHEQLLQWFTYHKPNEDQQGRYHDLRVDAHRLAQRIVECCPPSADRTAALRKLRETVMTANASIALEKPDA